MGVGARCVAAPSPQRQRSEGTKISSTFRPQPGLNQRFEKKIKGGLNQRFDFFWLRLELAGLKKNQTVSCALKKYIFHGKFAFGIRPRR